MNSIKRPKKASTMKATATVATRATQTTFPLSISHASLMCRCTVSSMKLLRMATSVSCFVSTTHPLVRKTECGQTKEARESIAELRILLLAIFDSKKNNAFRHFLFATQRHQQVAIVSTSTVCIIKQCNTGLLLPTTASQETKPSRAISPKIRHISRNQLLVTTSFYV